MEGFLVLSRQRDESIKIGSNVEVIVVDIRDGKVRLGIRAPKDVTVLRSEIVDDGRRAIGEVK